MRGQRRESRSTTADTKLGASNSHFPGGGVGEKLDALQRLPQLTEDCYSAIEQGATVGGRLHTTGVAVEQTHTHGSLQFCNRFGNVRLGRVEEGSRFVHAASLHHRHQDMEVMKLQAVSNSIVDLHLGSYAKPI
jgi:hypothetical protein